ncbi:unnamed protein product [Spodoptera exigua]|uniref:Pescadillo homolog n=1 Tax=Spodoptera exigua TaxID=7107 RepID=A0A922MK79_SPOEX|nr:hypothetical protein HF086_013391 [Spodoptera exigua]CAH0701677.1 unnamed protein product [Spodoptera exigua]
MVSKKKKKYSSGEGAQFMTRKAALKKLQLSLKDFRRICILKGIYPREPRNRKRAQKGAGGIKTLYHTKDIKFLLHEPIIWKLRELKVYQQKIRRARAMREYKNMKKYLRDYPEINIDHIVKERYPTFVDALRDLDDCLTLCFLFSTFPSLKKVPRDQSMLCRRLTVEFMHAIIAAKALRRVFVSVKGYYYQVELEGQTITWIVPHHFSFQPQNKDEVDFKIMSTFVEFYTMMLGFVNFKLYHSLNLVYPPKLTAAFSADDKELIDEQAYVAERIAAMNLSLARVPGSNEAEELPEMDIFDTEDNDPQKMEEAKLEAEKVKKLKTMFKGLKFFINREVPREPLVFIIRCFGGEVSWDKDHFVGATFDETDESIAYQIVDRPSMDKQYLSRYYVQPQWVFDSVNARTLLPINKYLMGAVLPPHLSPFVDKTKDQVYMPPEERALNDPNFKPLNEDESGSDIEEASDEDKEEEEQDSEEDGDAEAALAKQYQQEVEEDSDSDEEDPDDGLDPEKKKLAKEKKKAMAVTAGVPHKEHPYLKEIEDKQAFRLREKLVRKKHRNLYKSMKAGQEKRKKEIWLLRKKRRLHDEKVKEEKKAEKRKQRMQALEAST